MTLARRHAKEEIEAKVRRCVLCFSDIYVSCWLAFVFFSVSMLIIDKNLFSLKGRRRRLQETSEIRGLERCRSFATDLNLACERQTFLLVHRLGGTFREEERLRLSDRNSIPMT